MKKIVINKTFTKEDKEWFQLFGEEATKWFGKNCYWVPWKYSRAKIDYAWSIAQKERDKNFAHFIHNCTH
jgi:hypothetical protein